MKITRTISLGLFFYFSSQLFGKFPIQVYDFEVNIDRDPTPTWNMPSISAIDYHTTHDEPL
ncbi:MAG: hypothetical protein M0P61_03655 [Ignavibacteriaceae bacterium]|jgi:hypothetical protein|nr:hypothetical protein [Ignavibacteriaceae bacterium]